MIKTDPYGVHPAILHFVLAALWLVLAMVAFTALLIPYEWTAAFNASVVEAYRQTDFSKAMSQLPQKYGPYRPSSDISFFYCAFIAFYTAAAGVLAYIRNLYWVGSASLW